jgi:cytoskeletal protein RodZ
VDYTDFGRYLTQQRELRGVSRADVSTVTKIPVNLLAALENGQVERLPERIFIVNYIRAYAQVIGLESSETVLRFEEIDRTVHGTAAPATIVPVPKRPLLFGLPIAIVLIAIAVATLVSKGLIHLPWPK